MPELDQHDLLLILTLCELLGKPTRARDVTNARERVMKQLEQDASNEY